MNNEKLSFVMGNAKISISVAVFSLPAGWTCPMANECLSRSNRHDGKVTDGANTKFRCYATSEEARFPTVRKSRWKNLELLKSATSLVGMATLIQRSLSFGISFVRIHGSGDFFSESYFLAWLNVALNNPNTIFYGYTKRCDLIVKYKKQLPTNFRLTASYGGTHDFLIPKHRLNYAEVVFSTEEARRKGLEIDHDDSHAIFSQKSFALLLHGSQPANTDAARAWQQLFMAGYGYSNEKKTIRMERPVTIYVTMRQGGLPTHRVKPSVKFVPKKRPSPVFIPYKGREFIRLDL